MLQIIDGPVISRNDYAIAHMSNGLDEVSFQVSTSDLTLYPLLQEGKTRLLERTEGQTYLVRKINGAGSYAVITAVLDLADWQRDLLLDLSDPTAPGWAHTLTETNMLSRLLADAPALSGWRMVSKVQTHKTQAMEMDGPTPLEAAKQLQKTFGCALRFDTSARTVTILYPEELPLSNSYAVETVNLRRSPDYKGSTTDFCTRLYPIGANGLTIASVNGGLPYVEDRSYTADVIARLWKDSRYTDAASLMEAAFKKLKTLARPVRSWNLDVVDLHRIDPEKWPDLPLGIWTRIILVDSSRAARVPVIVTADQIWPYYPEKNKITVSTTNAAAPEFVSLQRMALRVASIQTDPNGPLLGPISAEIRRRT